MSTTTFALIVLAGAAFYFTKPDERKRLAKAGAERFADLVHAMRTGRAHDPFHALLLERTRWLIVTPLLVGLILWVWICMLFGGGASPQQTLIDWGANYAPRTTHGEWWRLAGYAFVHAGLFHMLATIAALVPLGMVLERSVGRAAFAAIYLASAIVAGTLSLWTQPATAVAVGASGAVLGLTGLLIAFAIYGYLREPRLPFSLIAAKRLGAGLAIFALYNLLSDDLSTVAELAGLTTGLLGGLVIARGVAEEKPPVLKSALVTGVVVVVALVAALPFHGTIDARPEIARIVEVETRTNSEYAKAVEAYTKGRLPAKALAQLIQRSILPALHADRARIEALRGVPLEQAKLVAVAKQYFELRESSWRRRMEGLQGSSMKTLRDADRVERSALDAFEQLQRDAGS
jgi:membrane associated rhomboid family serine protease